jgi:hypothetical protein
MVKTYGATHVITAIGVNSYTRRNRQLIRLHRMCFLRRSVGELYALARGHRYANPNQGSNS